MTTRNGGVTSLSGLPLDPHLIGEGHSLAPEDYPAGAAPADREMLHHLRHMGQELTLLRQYFRRPHYYVNPGEIGRVIPIGPVEEPLLSRIMPGASFAGSVLNGNVIVQRVPDLVAGPAADLIFVLDGNRLIFALDGVVTNTVNQPFAPGLYVTIDAIVGGNGYWNFNFNAGTPLGFEFESSLDIVYRSRDTVAHTITWGILAKRFTDVPATK